MKFLDFINQVFKGKSIGRILFNWQVQKHCVDLAGLTLDLAAGSSPSYYRYLSINGKLIKADLKKNKGIDKVVDLNNSLPFDSNYADNVLLFNAIYIIKEPGKLLKEVNRILKKDGVFFVNFPLIFNEAPEPNDYWRFTSQGIEKLLNEAGFSKIELHKIGERATASAGLMHNFYLFNICRFFGFLWALFLDSLIPKRVKKKYPCPMSYFVIVKK